MKRECLAIFDFDGTITKRDSFLHLIRYAVGNSRYIIGFLRYSPLLVLMKLHLYANWKIKQKIFSYFFAGMSIKQFNAVCESFCEDEFPEIVYSQAIREIEKRQEVNDTVVIISASVVNWVKKFAEKLSVSKVFATEIEVKNECLTGNFLTDNCYGKEKLNRLAQEYPDWKNCRIVVYGDSHGDDALLEIADEKHYKEFRV